MKIYVFVSVIPGSLIVDKIKFEGPLDPRRFNDVNAVMSCLPYFPTHWLCVINDKDYRQTRAEAVVTSILVVHS